MKKNISAIFFAIMAAALYGISAPISKLLLIELQPILMASLLYLGAGIGILGINIAKRLSKREKLEAKLTKKELPYIIGMVVLDIAAPIFLMLALTMTTAANVSLLNNFEIVATSMIALFIFKEAVGRRMWIAIALITTATMLLSVEAAGNFSFSGGSLFVILACICWGLENNCTRMLSLKDPMQIVVIKGFGSGVGSLIIAVIGGIAAVDAIYIGLALLLGFVAYGLSIYFYILAQRTLGAARTSAYYAVAPFVGVLISISIFGQPMSWSFITALVIMILGAYFAAAEHHKHLHRHEAIVHEHRHTHQDGHHTHVHEDHSRPEHSHVHAHDQAEHAHKHTPDTHHTHPHPH